MRAFYHPDQAIHSPVQFMRTGRICKATDVPERTTRLLDALARSGVTVEVPPALGDDTLMRVHPAHYLDFLRSAYERWITLPDHGEEVLANASPYWNGDAGRDGRPPCPSPHVVAQTNYYLGDLSVPLGAKSWVSMRASAWTALAGARALCDGAERAYALCRPSGHHARADRASGFCYLNNAALAAETLRETFARVAVLDIDAHHGDGTQEIFYRRDDVLTVSTHVAPDMYYPYFTGYAHETGHGAGTGCNINIPFLTGSGDAEFLAAVARGVAHVHDFGAEALVLALGYDTHKDDPLSAVQVTTAAFAEAGRLVAGLGVPVLVVQEGGYQVSVIGDCLEQFLIGLQG